DVFGKWNEGPLASFLIEITATVLRKKDADTGKPLVDLVQDKAGQKGTGKWTAQVALDLGISIPTIAAAIVGIEMPRSSATCAVHLPVPFWPALSCTRSTSGLPVSASFLRSTVAVISIRNDASGPSFHLPKTS